MATYLIIINLCQSISHLQNDCLRRILEQVMIGKLDAALHFQQTALSLRSQRQEVLASNIANADTPNYKARDVDFAQALKQATSAQSASEIGLTKTAHTHLDSATAETIGGMPVVYRQPQQGSIDGNTVEMDVERNQFLDNALRYEAGVTIVGARIKNLLAVIEG